MFPPAMARPHRIARYDDDTLDEQAPSEIAQEQLRKGPDLKTEGFNSRTAFFCASLSSSMYSDARVVQDLFDDIGITTFKWFTRDVDAPWSPFGVMADTRGAVGATPTFIVAAFRGTQEPEDWATNLKVVPKVFHSWGECHAGFMEGVDTVWGEEGSDGMLAYIKGLYEEQPRPVLLAGHSLGAALATIAAARLAAVHEIPIHGVYTIGSPRVFDKKAAAAYDAHVNAGKTMKEKTFRAVNCNDCVTVVPPEPPAFHVGTLIQINRRGELKTDEHWEAIRQHFEAVFKKGEFADFVLNHDSTRYLGAFQRAMEEAEGVPDIVGALETEDQEEVKEPVGEEEKET